LKKLLLIDGDEFVFRATAAVEHETRWDDQNHVLFTNENRAWDTLTGMIDRIFERFDTEEHVMCFSAPPNFRFTIDPTYKNNRAASRKPLCYGVMREKMDAFYKTKAMPGLEADDVMGILATKTSKAQKIIVSQDKDMKTIPTTIWNGKDLMHVTEVEANYWHLYQTLIGDTSDGYKGCPGVGPVKAEKLLTNMQNDPGGFTQADMWEVVKLQFEKAKLTEADALVQARLARILRYSDWDTVKKEPILWSPEPSKPDVSQNTSAKPCPDTLPSTPSECLASSS
jgi:DNA polymerase-1